MTEVYRRMRSDENDDPRTKCRERRRRRMKMRRVAGNSAAGSRTPSIPSQKDNRIENSLCVTEIKRLRMLPETSNMPAVATSSSASSGEKLEPVVSEALPSVSYMAEPVYGTMLVSGRALEMEDAVSVWTSVCRPDINQRRPLHFFVVYDGHGGPHVAALCKEKMPVFFEEELMHVSYDAESESWEGSSSRAEAHEQEAENAEEWKDMWRRVIARSFQRMDDLAITMCACGGVGYHNAGCSSAEVTLGGSTAVLAVLTSQHVIVANCGDSRAVLCRGGKAVPLSCDHKPDRPDERARIEAAGGRVIFVNGPRVEGILAMSRAIGDKYLKPLVTSDPEITFTKREPEDECLILASDGLWDVLSSDLACEVASECLREGNRGAVVSVEDGEAQILYPSRSALAAAVLTRLALGRKSFDNISVIVVDLKKSSRNRWNIGNSMLI